jgi:hypothetical protein
VAVRYVTIEPGETFRGRVMYMPRVTNAIRRVLDEVNATARDTQLVESKLLSSACGRAAERRLTGRTSYVGAAGDFGTEDEIMLRLGYEDDALRLYGRLIDVQARQVIDLRWRQVIDVADALLERRTLTGDELRDVVVASVDAEMRELGSA